MLINCGTDQRKAALAILTGKEVKILYNRNLKRRVGMHPVKDTVSRDLLVKNNLFGRREYL